MQGRWLPDHLHWAGIDQMVMQGAAITSDAVTSAEAMSDAGLEEWVLHTLPSCHHQALPTLQLPHDMATAQHQQISTFATTAGIGAAAEASDQDSALTTAVVSPSIEDDAALGEVLASQHWFDSFDLPRAYEEQVSNISSSRSGNDGHGVGCGRSCWGPQPPPQYTAMLRGELSLAVMSGVAGKSLIKEVCPCNCIMPCAVNILPANGCLMHWTLSKMMQLSHNQHNTYGADLHVLLNEAWVQIKQDVALFSLLA